MSKTTKTSKICTATMSLGLHSMRCELPEGHSEPHAGEGFLWQGDE